MRIYEQPPNYRFSYVSERELHLPTHVFVNWQKNYESSAQWQMGIVVTLDDSGDGKG